MNKTMRLACISVFLAATGCAHKTVVIDRPYGIDHAGAAYNERVRAGYDYSHFYGDDWPDMAVDIAYREDGGEWTLFSSPVSPSDGDHEQNIGSGGGWIKATWHGDVNRDATGRALSGLVDVTLSLDAKRMIPAHSKEQGDPRGYVFSTMNSAHTSGRYVINKSVHVADMKPSDKPRLFLEKRVMIHGSIWDVRMAVRPAQGIVSRAMMTSSDGYMSSSRLGTPLPEEQEGALSSVSNGGVSGVTERADFHDPVRPNRGGFGPMN